MWSKDIIEQFSLVDLHSTRETVWYGPFNVLLCELTEHFQVTPQCQFISRGPQDLAVLYVIRRPHVPVFFIEIKPWPSLTVNSLPEAGPIRRFDEYLFNDLIRTPKFISISAFGPKICVYTLTTETGSIEPTAVEAHLELTDDTAPENRWAYDIITDEGKTKLRTVAMDIKSMVANI